MTKLPSWLTTAAAITFVLHGSAHASTQTTTISVTDGGDHVRIYVRGVKTQSTRFYARGDRVSLALTKVKGSHTASVTDPTVKQIDVRGRTYPRVSIKLRHGAETTRRLARAATVETGADHIVIRLPRQASNRSERAGPTDKSEVKKPAAPPLRSTETKVPPVAPHAASANAAKPGRTAAPMAAHTAKKLPSERDGAESTVVLDADATGPAMAGAAVRPVQDSHPVLGSNEGGGGGGSMLAGMLMLIVLVCGAVIALWLRRRKSQQEPAGDPLEIVASKNLTAKSRVVLMRAADRDLLLSVTDKGTELLTEWATSDDNARVDDKPWRFDDEPDPVGKTAPAFAQGTNQLAQGSPAVDGIMRLKSGRTAGRPVRESAFRDSEWVKELYSVAKAEGTNR